MYEKFLELPADKQQCIINAAMEIFSKNDYKRAVTDDIAAKAGISKGSLFTIFTIRNPSIYIYTNTLPRRWQGRSWMRPTGTSLISLSCWDTVPARKRRFW